MKNLYSLKLFSLISVCFLTSIINAANPYTEYGYNCAGKYAEASQAERMILWQKFIAYKDSIIEINAKIRHTEKKLSRLKKGVGSKKKTSYYYHLNKERKELFDKKVRMEEAINIERQKLKPVEGFLATNDPRINNHELINSFILWRIILNLSVNAHITLRQIANYTQYFKNELRLEKNSN